MRVFRQTTSKNNDKLKLESAFRAHYSNLVQFAYFKVSDKEKAKDLVQECFVKLWENKSVFEEGGNIKAFLFKILNNAIIDFYRTKKAEIGPVSEEDIAGEEKERSALENDHVQDRLNLLPVDIKTVFLLNKYSGFKYAEIAETLAISVKTVEAKMGKALKIFREAQNNDI
jgi:RNA polymerase sigma-70 factor (ECF subfamily)